GRVPGRNLTAAHAAGELQHLAPARADVARARQAHPYARLAVDGVAGDAPAGPARDHRLERPHGVHAGDDQPEGRVLGGGQRDQAACLRPGDLAAVEGVADGGKPCHALDDVGDRLQLARGEPETLARVVAQAGEAQVVVVAAAEEAVGEGAENPPGAGLLTGEAAQVAV